MRTHSIKKIFLFNLTLMRTHSIIIYIFTKSKKKASEEKVRKRANQRLFSLIDSLLFHLDYITQC